MKMSFFWIPALDSQEAAEELNAFLNSHRVVQVEKAFVGNEKGVGWSLCVQWVEQDGGAELSSTSSKKRVDYREILDEESFRIFAILRSWRKEKAASEGVPIYTIATNEQLAEVVRGRIQSKGELAKVGGFGKARQDKYGEELLAACRREFGTKEAG